MRQYLDKAWHLADPIGTLMLGSVERRAYWLKPPAQMGEKNPQ